MGLNRCVSVSVVVVFRDVQRYMGAAIESLLAQTLRDTELILVDDGSTDGSARVADEYARRDPRIRVIRTEPRGIPAARNSALGAAGCDLVAVLDADDVAEPGRLQAQVAYMRAHPDCVALGTQALLIDADGDEIGRSDQPLTHEAIDASLLEGFGSALIQTSLMVRKAALDAVGGYREHLQVSEDLDLFLRLAEHGRLVNLPEVLVRVRRHCESISAIGNQVEADNPRQAIVSEACRRRGLPDRRISSSIPRHPATKAEWHAKWAVRACRNGYVAAGRKHARKALRCNPLALWGWRALLRAYLGSPTYRDAGSRSPLQR